MNAEALRTLDREVIRTLLVTAALTLTYVWAVLGYDLYRLLTVGHRGTITWAMMELARVAPGAVLLLGLAVGLTLGHLFLR